MKIKRNKTAEVFNVKINQLHPIVSTTPILVIVMFRTHIIFLIGLSLF